MFLSQWKFEILLVLNGYMFFTTEVLFNTICMLYVICMLDRIIDVPLVCTIKHFILIVCD